ncbi:hypothetical protein Glove_169g61 [Diversispora epigaea]|uniref:Uncharacterized protein n=1 Tax=Diversispora epigaea TaxID=1348612 RepID=A0A397IPE8_9GLOM|nr:hypothetical protein Glove_169g61 [Diversispora epigaea]
MTDSNEATRCEFISSILMPPLQLFENKPKKKNFIYVSGEEVSGRVDYTIKEDLMCIAEGKPRNVKIGYLQNIKQLESAYHTNKNKRKRIAEQAFHDDYDYLYGIASTALNGILLYLALTDFIAR